MAVIDISMDMPKSCDICPKRWKCELDILVKSYFPYNVVKDEYTNKRHKDCPLKSTDEMIAEIKGNFDKHGIVSLYNKGINDTLKVVRKYCDKENNEK